MTYREVIRAPWWVYGTAIALAALFCFTFAAVVGVPSATVLFIALAALAAWVIERRRLVLTVDEQTFQVGEVGIPREQIADAVALTEEGLRVVAGPDADGRALMVLRNLATKEGVKVDIRSGQAPYWLVSSKSPQELANALNH